MADLSVHYLKASSREQAQKAVRDFLTPDYIAKWKVKAKVDIPSLGNEIKATGKGFTLVLEFREEKVEAKLTLSLLLRPLKGKILSSVENELKKVV